MELLLKFSVEFLMNAIEVVEFRCGNLQLFYELCK
jgi:hypothetical protein